MFDGAALLTAGVVGDVVETAVKSSTGAHWALKDTVAQPVMSLVDSSEASSSGAMVVPGEVVRFRMVVQLDTGSVGGGEVRPQLPSGLVFINDGSATVALVANQGGVSASGLPAGAGLNVSAGGSGVSDIAAIRPTYVIPGAAIVDASGAPVAAGAMVPSGSEPRFMLGNVVNADADADGEYIVIEFNAVVANEAGNVEGATRTATFDWRNAGGLIDSSTSQVLTLGEPSIIDVDKRVVAVAGNQVTFEVVFSNTGSKTAHDVRIFDDFAGASNISFSGGGTVTGLPAGTLNQSDADTLDVRIAALAPGQSVSVRYQGTLTVDWMPTPTRDVNVTYTSLSAAGASLSTTVASGTVVTNTLGERTGDVANPGGALKAYRDSDGIGLNKVLGVVWDDTKNPDGMNGAGEAKLQGVRVTLRHAGADGILDNADDVTQFTDTDANGVFRFSNVPDGFYRVSVPTKVLAGNGGTLGDLCVRIDSESAPTDGKVLRTVAGGISQDGNDFGFVQLNDAPTVTVPEGLCVTRDARLPITGLVVGDVDAGNGALTVTLSASSGVLDVAPPAGSTALVTGNGTKVLTLNGTVTELNQVLATLGFQQVSGACGAVTVQVKVDDNGHTGDANHDGVPSEAGKDNLCAEAKLVIEVKDPSAPPVSEHVVQVISQSQSGRPVPVKPPAVQDPNDPNSALVVRIEGISNTDAGYFVLPDGTRLVAGQQITVDQLQHLSFVPRPGYSAPLAADGTMVGSTVSFSVIDPCCGTGCGSIEVKLTPVVVPVVPVTPVEPLRPVEVLPIVIGGGWVRPDPIVLEPLPLPELDAGGLFPAMSAKGFFGDERIGPLVDNLPVEAQAAPPAEDCIPLPKPKPKPVKKVLGDVVGKPSPRFSEQLDVHKKKFKPPVKAQPTPVTARQC